jgi:hypothetical protein
MVHLNWCCELVSFPSLKAWSAAQTTTAANSDLPLQGEPIHFAAGIAK